MSFLWLHSRSAGRICTSNCARPLGHLAVMLTRERKDKKGQTGSYCARSSKRRLLLVVTLSMMIALQLTACWGSTSLKDGMGWEVIGLTPALQATCYLLRCCFLARPATAREMQQAQKCTLGCTPSTP